MLSRRKITTLFWCAPAMIALMASPLHVRIDGTWTLELQAAFAKDNGGRGGNGNGGGKGGGQGNGNGSGNGSGKGSNSRSDGARGNTTGAKGKNASIDDASVEVRHVEGITEFLRNGRYVMKDAKGRTIINRKASRADRNRLNAFLR